MNNIFIRVDSGRTIGMGHLMRCRNLAESLVGKITFISKEHEIFVVLPSNFEWLIMGISQET